MADVKLNYPAPEYADAEAASKGLSSVLRDFLDRIDDYHSAVQKHAANDWEASEVA